MNDLSFKEEALRISKELSEEEILKIAIDMSKSSYKGNLNMCLVHTLSELTGINEYEIEETVKGVLDSIHEEIGCSCEELTLGNELSKDVMIRTLSLLNISVVAFENKEMVTYGEGENFIDEGFIRLDYSKENLSGHYSWVKH